MWTIGSMAKHKTYLWQELRGKRWWRIQTDDPAIIRKLRKRNSASLCIWCINDKMVVEGNSSNVLGNPINSLRWLLNTLAKKQKNLPINSYVSTGTCTPAIPIQKNNKICADFGKLGKINFKYY